MTTKATEKIIEALTQLVEGFAELQEKLEEDYDPDVATDSDDDDSDSDEEETSSEIGEAMVTEIKSAVEAVIENEDCAPEDLASIVSALTDALEEIDPEVFSHGEVEEEEEEEDEEEYEDIDDDDFDEDYDEDEDDEDEDEDEEEEEEDDDEDEEEDEDDDD